MNLSERVGLAYPVQVDFAGEPSGSQVEQADFAGEPRGSQVEKVDFAGEPSHVAGEQTDIAGEQTRPERYRTHLHVVQMR